MGLLRRFYIIQWYIIANRVCCWLDLTWIFLLPECACVRVCLRHIFHFVSLATQSVGSQLTMIDTVRSTEGNRMSAVCTALLLVLTWQPCYRSITCMAYRSVSVSFACHLASSCASGKGRWPLIRSTSVDLVCWHFYPTGLMTSKAHLWVRTLTWEGYL